ncbi:MAG: hypothetical protein AAGE89_09780 [Pseudomonadota bacterium]
MNNRLFTKPPMRAHRALMFGALLALLALVTNPASADDIVCPLSDDELRQKIQLTAQKNEIADFENRLTTALDRRIMLDSRDRDIHAAKYRIRKMQTVPTSDLKIGPTKLFGLGEGKHYDKLWIGTKDWKVEFVRGEYEKQTKHKINNLNYLPQESMAHLVKWAIKRKQAEVKKLKGVPGDTNQAYIDVKSLREKLKALRAALAHTKKQVATDVWLGNWQLRVTDDTIGRTGKMTFKVSRIGDTYTLQPSVPFSATITEMGQNSIVFKLSDPLSSTYRLSLNGRDALQGKMTLPEHPPTATITGERACVTAIGPVEN